MGTASENSPIADAHIVTHYPEMVDIADTMDAIAAVGRKLWTLTLEDKDHGSAVKDSLETTLIGQGYTVTLSQGVDTVTVAIP